MHGGRAYHEDDRVRAGVDVNYRGIQGHQLVLWRVEQRVRGNHCAPAWHSGNGSHFSSLASLCGRHILLGPVLQRQLRGRGHHGGRLLTRPVATRTGERAGPTQKDAAWHFPHAPVDDLPHLDADDVVWRGRAGPRNLGGRNLRAADVLPGASAPCAHTQYVRQAWSAPGACVPWLIGRHEPAPAQALQEARLPGAQVAFHHHLGKGKVAWLSTRRGRRCDSGHVAVRRCTLTFRL